MSMTLTAIARQAIMGLIAGLKDNVRRIEPLPIPGCLGYDVSVIHQEILAIGDVHSNHVVDQNIDEAMIKVISKIKSLAGRRDITFYMLPVNPIYEESACWSTTCGLKVSEELIPRLGKTIIYIEVCFKIT